MTNIVIALTDMLFCEGSNVRGDSFLGVDQRNLLVFSQQEGLLRLSNTADREPHRWWMVYASISDQDMGPVNNAKRW